ncbi:MAG: bifunctional phosphoribosyl-AMP cyclohydrolase/phosphoribosyl-ATP diphosphatase HisIE [Byssovorax sp.]
MDLAFGESGLLPAVVQDRLTGQVRMVGYMSRESLAATLRTGRATFFSRSRSELWEKGQSSGNTLRVVSLHADCDADTILVLAEPTGPTCHTGTPSCFFRRIGEDGALTDEASCAATFLEELEREIEARKQSVGAKSYTRHLLDGGAERIGAKIREEADELARAIEGESDERVASEAADVLYHAMVGLASRGVALRDVIAKLAARAGTSGHEEKARR